VTPNIFIQKSLPIVPSKSRNNLSKLILSGSRLITSLGIVHLLPQQGSRQELDPSRCFKIDGQTLTAFVLYCPELRPHRFSYCKDIEDGPYQNTANGCLNLECEVRLCCQNTKLRF